MRNQKARRRGGLAGARRKSASPRSSAPAPAAFARRGSPTAGRSPWRGGWRCSGAPTRPGRYTPGRRAWGANPATPARRPRGRAPGRRRPSAWRALRGGREGQSARAPARGRGRVGRRAMPGHRAARLPRDEEQVPERGPISRDRRGARRWGAGPDADLRRADLDVESERPHPVEREREVAGAGGRALQGDRPRPALAVRQRRRRPRRSAEANWLLSPADARSGSSPRGSPPVTSMGQGAPRSTGIRSP